MVWKWFVYYNNSSKSCHCHVSSDRETGQYGERECRHRQRRGPHWSGWEPRSVFHVNKGEWELMNYMSGNSPHKCDLKATRLGGAVAAMRQSCRFISCFLPPYAWHTSALLTLNVTSWYMSKLPTSWPSPLSTLPTFGMKAAAQPRTHDPTLRCSPPPSRWTLRWPPPRSRSYFNSPLISRSIFEAILTAQSLEL